MTTTVPSYNDWVKVKDRLTVAEAENVDMRDRLTVLEEQVRVITGGTATEEVP